MIAFAIAVVLSAVTILRPADIALWSLQSKLFSHEPSGEIVLVTDTSRDFDISIDNSNVALIGALEQLEKAGAKQVVLHTPLREGDVEQINQRLERSIALLGEKAVIARSISSEEPMGVSTERNAPRFEKTSKIVSSYVKQDFLRFVWWADPSQTVNATEYSSMWKVLVPSYEPDRAIYPDYSIAVRSIPEIDIYALASGDPETLKAVSSKRVIVAGLGRDDRMIKTPDGHAGLIGPAKLHALAAETAKAGSGQFFGSMITVPTTAVLLVLLILASKSNHQRRIGYGLLATGAVIVFFVAADLGLRVLLAEPAVLLILYAAQRATANWRRRHLYTDPRSQLSNFIALHRDLEAEDNLRDRVIVVAKVARLDAMFATLRGSEQGEYLRQIANRLALSNDRSGVYHDGGKYFAMVLKKADYPDLQGHLEGLRAIACQAIMISERALDVAITVGVDQSSDARASNRISSAIAAADQAREAYRPVFIISDFETDSEAWDYSLQSRLEAALSENRISIKLQPKVDMQTGLFVGAEALARWTDKERGEIPPNQFILQCERVGRLDELTKRVMNRSLSASCDLAAAGQPAKISVNVSAIQFVDNRIVELIEKSLLETGANPANIMIELTETARIENFARAREIMEQIGSLGIEFSIDDFGVGSGNLDALYHLPFRELKIDRMFANSVSTSAEARKIVGSLMSLSREMGISSVAEGIDNFATFEMLRDMGGDLAQGYCIARPQTLSLLQETLSLQRGDGILKKYKG
ncbi:MAG: GGDEF domain-containing phosphodiesterase [Pseudomonadota bacterium]|nr:GGDEF domain-containing phosphodiesterase [Pseudomonadota bacterium]